MTLAIRLASSSGTIRRGVGRSTIPTSCAIAGGSRVSSLAARVLPASARVGISSRIVVACSTAVAAALTGGGPAGIPATVVVCTSSGVVAGRCSTTGGIAIGVSACVGVIVGPSAAGSSISSISSLSISGIGSLAAGSLVLGLLAIGSLSTGSLVILRTACHALMMRLRRRLANDDIGGGPDFECMDHPASNRGEATGIPLINGSGLSHSGTLNERCASRQGDSEGLCDVEMHLECMERMGS